MTFRIFEHDFLNYIYIFTPKFKNNQKTESSNSINACILLYIYIYIYKYIYITLTVIIQQISNDLGNNLTFKFDLNNERLDYLSLLSKR